VASITLIAPRERSVRRPFYRRGCGRVERELGGARRDVCIALDDVRVDDRTVRLR